MNQRKTKVAPLKNQTGQHLPTVFRQEFSGVEKPETLFDIARLNWVKQLTNQAITRYKSVYSKIFYDVERLPERATNQASKM